MTVRLGLQLAQAMDDMIQLEDFCVFCSKYLAGMHDFNKKMHFNTCKLRKLFDSVYKNSDSGDDIDQIFMDDNCSFCLKSLKDFKSDYNKRIHIKCCKIKKETFDRRDSILQLQQCEELSHSAASSTQCNESQTLYQSLTEACIFCNKPLSNLNSFNRKMHIEHCKIRKSLEGTVRSRGKNKSENLSKQDGANIGDHCVYCDKSFARLSDFNRRLHSEHCKSKKRKLKTLNNVISSSLNLSSLQSTESGYVSNLDQVQNSLILLANNSCANISLSTSNSLDISSISDQSSIQTNSLSQSPVCMDSNQLCEYCSRSLANLSNFNKNIHIEQCKLKQSKKTNNSQEKYSTKPPRKRVKSDKNKINQSEL